MYEHIEASASGRSESWSHVKLSHTLSAVLSLCILVALVRVSVQGLSLNVEDKALIHASACVHRQYIVYFAIH